MKMALQKAELKFEAKNREAMSELAPLTFSGQRDDVKSPKLGSAWLLLCRKLQKSDLQRLGERGAEGICHTCSIDKWSLPCYTKFTLSLLITIGNCLLIGLKNLDPFKMTKLDKLNERLQSLVLENEDVFFITVKNLKYTAKRKPRFWLWKVLNGLRAQKTLDPIQILGF